VRGYLIDERVVEGRWFRNPLLLRLARAVERGIFSRCAGAVTLTSPSAADIASGRFGAWDARKPLSVIPTCANYDVFRLERRADGIPSALRSRLREKLVVGYVGAVNRSYRVEQALLLFKHLHALRPDAHLLCLTLQTEALASAIERAGLAAPSVTLTSAAPWEMPAWLGWIDWGLHLLEVGEAKRASMPTKLAEFLASGVRPVHHGCNEEVSEWVEHCGSGYVLPTTNDAALRHAAAFVASAPAAPGLLARARELSRPHFGLEAGLDRYQEVVARLLSDSEP
jgi:glycosyltransferase involved in cell wall biosynthesis